MFLKILLWGLCWGIFYVDLEGKQIQFVPDLIFHPTWKTRYFRSYQNLSGIWRTPSDEIYRVPFVEDERKDLVVRKEFFMKDRARDTLYLYFGGLSWEAEVYLNGKLLGIYNSPFEEIVIPVPPELFTIQWNWLEVHLKKYANQTDAWWTVPYLGIHKSVFLLRKDREQRVLGSAYVGYADSVLIYFPFSKEYLYNISDRELIRDLEFMRRIGVKAIYMPYFVPPRVKRLLNLYGIYLVGDYLKARRIAIYRSYGEMNVYPFWLDAGDRRSSFYGKYVEPGGNQLFRSVSELSRPWIVFYGLLSLFLLLVYRLMDYEGYQNLWYVMPSVRRIQSFVLDFRLVNAFSLKYMYVVRVVMKSLVISLLINYLHATDNLRYLNVWHKNNLLYGFSRDYGESIGGCFLGVLGFFLVLNWVKIWVWQWVEWIYGFKDYRNRNLMIEVYGEMPFLFIAFLGVMIMMLVGGYWGLWILGVSYGIMLIQREYFLVSVYYLVYRIPFSVIFFYLCTFELLPWLLFL